MTLKVKNTIYIRENTCRRLLNCRHYLNFRQNFAKQNSPDRATRPPPGGAASEVRAISLALGPQTKFLINFCQKLTKKNCQNLTLKVKFDFKSQILTFKSQILTFKSQNL